MSTAPTAGAASSAEEVTLVEHAMALIREDLIAGALPPGKKLAVQELVNRYEIGATPIREALSRMSLSGMVIPIGNRGFRASELSFEDLSDITAVRQVIEMEALRRSIALGGLAWESSIVAALYQLQRLGARTSSEGEPASESAFDLAHKAFHRSLIAACASPRMLDLHDSLYDQAHRYRRVMMRSVRSEAAFNEKHQQLVDSVLSRDPDVACTALSHHLGLALAFVYPHRKQDMSVLARPAELGGQNGRTKIATGRG
jgi:DNA-binding GntR family transcriptional regulator